MGCSYCIDGKQTHLGLFDTKEEAFEKYKAKVRELNLQGYNYYIPEYKNKHLKHVLSTEFTNFMRYYEASICIPC
jgi:hypothetical protein